MAQILKSRNDRVGLSALRCIIKGDLLNEENLFFLLASSLKWRKTQENNPTVRLSQDNQVRNCTLHECIKVFTDIPSRFFVSFSKDGGISNTYCLKLAE